MRWRVANQAPQFPGEIPIPADMALWFRGPHTNRVDAIAGPSPTPSRLTAGHRPRAAQPAEIRTAPGQRSANLRYILNQDLTHNRELTHATRSSRGLN